jgi:hypothetical protein
MVCGIFCYFLNYPSVFSAACQKPKMRKWGTQGLYVVAPVQPNSPSGKVQVEVPDTPLEVFKASMSSRDV